MATGLIIYGEQRGAAAGDFNEDGRVDLVVAQNGAATKLFQNAGAKPGLRVRLRGPPGNPQGIGAIVRAHFQDRVGPAQEVHAGSGYWSQDGSVLVLALPETPRRIVVNWPGGKTTEAQIAAGQREVSLSP